MQHCCIHTALNRWDSSNTPRRLLWNNFWFLVRVEISQIIFLFACCRAMKSAFAPNETLRSHNRIPNIQISWDYMIDPWSATRRTVLHVKPSKHEWSSIITRCLEMPMHSLRLIFEFCGSSAKSFTYEPLMPINSPQWNEQYKDGSVFLGWSLSSVVTGLCRFMCHKYMAQLRPYNGFSS